MERKYTIILIIIALVSFISIPAGAEDRDMETARILKDLRSPAIDKRIAGYKALDFSGIVDESIFQEINRRLTRSYLNAGHERERVYELRLIVQALATSGNPKYIPDIEKVIAAGRHVDEDARKHAERQLYMLEYYTEWNQIINQPIPNMSWKRSRVENLLRTNDDRLRKEGLKHAQKLRDSEPQVFDTIETQLNEMLSSDLSDPKRQDLAAWYCKTLGFSGNKKYLPIIERAASESFPKKLRKYAIKSRSMINEGTGQNDEDSE